MAALLPFAPNGKTNTEILTVNYANLTAPNNKIHTFPKGSFYVSETYGIDKATDQILKPNIDYKVLQLEGITLSTDTSIAGQLKKSYTCNVILLLKTGLTEVEWHVDYTGGQEQATIDAFTAELARLVGIATSANTLPLMYSAHQGWAGYVSTNLTQKIEPRLIMLDKYNKQPNDERDWAEVHMALSGMTETIVSGDPLVEQAFLDWLRHNESRFSTRRQHIIDLVQAAVTKWKSDTISVGQYFFSDNFYSSVERKGLRLKRITGQTFAAIDDQEVGGLTGLKEGNDHALRLTGLFQHVGQNDSILYERFEVSFNRLSFVQGQDQVLATFKRLTQTNEAANFTLQIYSQREGVVYELTRSMSRNNSRTLTWTIPLTVRDYPDDVLIARVVEAPGFEARANLLITSRSFGYTFDINAITVAGKLLKQPRISITRSISVIPETLYVFLSGDLKTDYAALAYPITMNAGETSKSLTIDLLPDNMLADGSVVNVKVCRSNSRNDPSKLLATQTLYIVGMKLSDDVGLAWSANATGGGATLIEADEGKDYYLIATYPYDVRQNGLRQQLVWSGQMVLNTDFTVSPEVVIANQKIAYKVSMLSDTRPPTNTTRSLRVKTKDANEISLAVKDTTYGISANFSYVTGLTGSAYTTPITSTPDNANIYLKGIIPQAIDGTVVELMLAADSPMAGRITFPSQVSVVQGQISPLISLVGDYRITGQTTLKMLAKIGANVFNVPELNVLDVSIPTYAVTFLDKDLKPITQISEGETFRIMVKGYGDPAVSPMYAAISTSYSNVRAVNDVVTSTGSTAILAKNYVEHGNSTEVKVNTGNWLSILNDGITDGDTNFQVKIEFPTVNGVKQGKDTSATLKIIDSSKNPLYTGEFLDAAGNPISTVQAGSVISLRLKPVAGQVLSGVKSVSMSVVTNNAKATISSTTFDDASKQAYGVISVLNQATPVGLVLKVATTLTMTDNSTHSAGEFSLIVSNPAMTLAGVFTNNTQSHAINPQAVYPELFDGLVEGGKYVYKITTQGVAEGTTLTLRLASSAGNLSYTAVVANNAATFILDLTVATLNTYSNELLRYMHPVTGGTFTVQISDGEHTYSHANVVIRSKGFSTQLSHTQGGNNCVVGLVIKPGGTAGMILDLAAGGGGGGTNNAANDNPAGVIITSDSGSSASLSFYDPTVELTKNLLVARASGGDGGDVAHRASGISWLPENTTTVTGYRGENLVNRDFNISTTINGTPITLRAGITGSCGRPGVIGYGGVGTYADVAQYTASNGGDGVGGAYGGGAGAVMRMTLSMLTASTTIPAGKFLAPIPFLVNFDNLTGKGGNNTKTNPATKGGDGQAPTYMLRAT